MARNPDAHRVLTTSRIRPRPARGFTLLEVAVTLVLIGLAAALIAPSVFREASSAPALGRVLAQAREVAVRRAQSLAFGADEQGNWKLTTVDDTTTIGAGRFEGPAVALRLRITPLGACLAEGATPPGDWDAIACAPAAGGGQR